MFAAGSAASSSQPSRVAQHPTVDFAMINCWGYANEISSPCSLSLDATSAIDGIFLQARGPPERTKPGTNRATVPTLQWTSGHYPHRPWRPSRCLSPILPALTVALQPDDLAPDMKLRLCVESVKTWKAKMLLVLFSCSKMTHCREMFSFLVRPEHLEQQRHSAPSCR